jgi:hypothetical protein
MQAIRPHLRNNPPGLQTTKTRAEFENFTRCQDDGAVAACEMRRPGILDHPVKPDDDGGNWRGKSPSPLALPSS